MAVALRCEGGCGRLYAARMRADARRLMAICGLTDCELSVVIGDDTLLRALNGKFRGKYKPTDVLAFPQIEDPRGRRGAAQPRPACPAGTSLGDIVISMDMARRQARRLGVARAARMRTLMVHGFLHLLGYDHERSLAEARRMFARERELAAALDRTGCARRVAHGKPSATRDDAATRPCSRGGDAHAFHARGQNRLRSRQAGDHSSRGCDSRLDPDGAGRARGRLPF